MSLTLFVYILHFIHISLLDFRFPAQASLLGSSVHIARFGRGAAQIQNLLLFCGYFFLMHFNEGNIFGSCVGPGSTVGVCGARGVPVEPLPGCGQGTGAAGAGESKLQSILGAEEDPAIAQDQLETTVKTEIVICDK